MPKTPDQLFEVLARDLATYSALPEVKALFSRANDPWHILELLAESPGMFRIIAAWLGEDPEGTSPRSGIVKHRFTVTISMNRGLPMMFQKQLSLPREDGALPLVKRVALVRDRVRSLVWTVAADKESELIAEYGGCEPVKYENAQLDAFQLTFFLRASMTLNTPRG